MKRLILAAVIMAPGAHAAPVASSARVFGERKPEPVPCNQFTENLASYGQPFIALAERDCMEGAHDGFKGADRTFHKKVAGFEKRMANATGADRVSAGLLLDAYKHGYDFGEAIR